MSAAKSRKLCRRSFSHVVVVNLGAMKDEGFALFETAIGACGIAWADRGLRGLQLPEAGVQGTRARMKARFPAFEETKPPRPVALAIAAVKALLLGKKVAFDRIALDMDGLPPFRCRVYEAARKVGAGCTVTYGEIALQIGSPGAARAVGQALGRNPFPVVVPCHRVIAAGGRAGGFTAEGGVATKMRMLEIEGAVTPGKSSPIATRETGAPFDAAARSLRKAAHPVLRTNP